MSADRDLPAASDTVLAICTAPDNDYGERLARLVDSDWAELLHLAIEQRAAPLLQRAIRNAHAAPAVPALVREALDRHVLQLARTMLHQRQTMATITALLDTEGLHPIALKGVRLANREYPAPVLRPMRDLDLLLEPREAERAQSLLVAHPDFALAEWSGEFGVEEGHQLPTLVDRRFGTFVEIHHRLNARQWAEEGRLLARVHAEAEDLAMSGGGAIRVPSAHANLLHIVEHATVHHLFDNGPVVLADLHYIAASGAIDWPRLIEEAANLGLGRALRLVAALAIRHGASWVPEALMEDTAIDPVQLVAAEAVILRGPEERAHLGLLRRFDQRTGQRGGLAAALQAALSPSPYSLAEIVGCRAGDARRWLAYPLWLAHRIRAHSAARRSPAAADAAAQVALAQWLGGRG